MDQYEIILFNKHYCLVAINTVYNVGEVIKKIVNSKIKCSHFNGIVIFDLLLSSFSYNDINRFFCYKCVNGSIDYRKRIKNYPIPPDYIISFNNYFRNNENIMKNSFLLK